jgi:hypothetical protein
MRRHASFLQSSPDDPVPTLESIAGSDPSTTVTPFCHVCRYILVDQIAPTLHGLMDDLYSVNYPQ